MPNPFYRGQQSNPMMNMMNQFNQFRNQFGNGDPRQIVANMLQSGQMSKQQFEQLSQQAMQFRQFLGR